MFPSQVPIVNLCGLVVSSAGKEKYLDEDTGSVALCVHLGQHSQSRKMGWRAPGSRTQSWKGTSLFCNRHVRRHQGIEPLHFKYAENLQYQYIACLELSLRLLCSIPDTVERRAYPGMSKLFLDGYKGPPLTKLLRTLLSSPFGSVLYIPRSRLHFEFPV